MSSSNFSPSELGNKRLREKNINANSSKAQSKQVEQLKLFEEIRRKKARRIRTSEANRGYGLSMAGKTSSENRTNSCKRAELNSEKRENSGPKMLRNNSRKRLQRKRLLIFQSESEEERDCANSNHGDVEGSSTVYPMNGVMETPKNSIVTDSSYSSSQGSKKIFQEETGGRTEESFLEGSEEHNMQSQELSEESDDIGKQDSRMFIPSKITVQELAKSQEEILTPRRERMRLFEGKWKSTLQTSSGRNLKRQTVGNKERSLTVSEKWNEDLKSLSEQKPDFFSSAEATMKETGTTGKGRPAYASLPISHLNCSDVRHVYEVEYAIKIQDGHSRSSYAIFCSVVGQYMRLAVVLGLADVWNVCKPGAVFKAIVDRDCLRIFFNYFEIRGAVTTSMTKAIHLGKVAEFSVGFYEGKGNSEMKSLASLSHIYLRGVRSSKKQMGRREATKRKQFYSRLEEGKILLPQDFAKCTKLCTRKLSKIRSYVLQKSEDLCRRRNEIVGRNSKKAIPNEVGDGEMKLDSDEESERKSILDMGIHMFKTNIPLANKWCMNMLCLLILTAGGQRPQVFTQLQAPCSRQMDFILDQFKRKGFLELQTLAEKTMRSVDMPHVVFPSSTLAFIKFHMEYMRPVLLERGKWDKEDMERMKNRPLFLNTKNGAQLTSQQVTCTLKTFMKSIDEGFSNVTTMTLRASYATMMMRSYKEKEIHKDMTEEEFVNHLGKCMNTSPEQLLTTYISLDTSHFEEAARKMVHALCVATGNEALKKDSTLEEEGSSFEIGVGDSSS